MTDETLNVYVWLASSSVPRDDTSRKVCTVVLSAFSKVVTTVFMPAGECNADVWAENGPVRSVRTYADAEKRKTGA